MIVYKITNRTNWKAYIGQTSKTLRERWIQHSQPNRKRACPLIRDAIAKYGKENFDVVILEECFSKKHLNEREHFWITSFNTVVPNGYNLTTGGDRVELAEVSRQKIANTLKGRPNPRKGIPTNRVPWNKGKSWPTDVRKKMSDAQKRPGYVRPRGWKMSEEVRRRMSESRRGVPNIKNRGRIFTEETKLKMSLRKRGMRISPKTEFKSGDGAKVIRNLDTGEVFFSMRAAAAKYKCDPSNFSKCANGVIKTVLGYRWEFAHARSQPARKSSRLSLTQESAQMRFDFQ